MLMVFVSVGEEERTAVVLASTVALVISSGDMAVAPLRSDEDGGVCHKDLRHAARIATKLSRICVSSGNTAAGRATKGVNAESPMQEDDDIDIDVVVVDETNGGLDDAIK
jgi:hypothetical protein